MTAQTREILVLDVLGRGEGRVDGVAGGLVGEDVHGGVAHCAFEGVAGIAGLQGGEAVCEPGWGRRLWREGGVSRLLVVWGRRR